MSPRFLDSFSMVRLPHGHHVIPPHPSKVEAPGIRSYARLRQHYRSQERRKRRRPSAFFIRPLREAFGRVGPRTAGRISKGGTSEK